MSLLPVPDGVAYDEGHVFGKPLLLRRESLALHWTSGTSTLTLLDRARSGDRTATDELYARALGPLTRFATGRLPPWARELLNTDDLVQETVLRSLRNVEDFESTASGAFFAYLRTGVLNRIRDELRRHGNRPFRTEFDEGIADGRSSPVEDAVGAEALADYEQALHGLRPQEREAVVARVEMGLSYLEIASLLDKSSADAARMATGRALAKLAAAMSHGG